MTASTSLSRTLQTLRGALGLSVNKMARTSDTCMSLAYYADTGHGDRGCIALMKFSKCVGVSPAVLLLTPEEVRQRCGLWDREKERLDLVSFGQELAEIFGVDTAGKRAAIAVAGLCESVQAGKLWYAKYGEHMAADTAVQRCDMDDIS